MLSLLSWIYGKLIDLRNMLYDRGVFESTSLGARTISIGNITTGGTGKTPLVAYVAAILADRGETVCILSRGYGRKNPKKRVLVSGATEIFASVEVAGDEPFELAQKLLGKAIVISDADRVAAGEWAKRKFGVTAFVLHAFTSLPFWFAIAGIVAAWYCYLLNPAFPDRVQQRLAPIYTLGLAGRSQHVLRDNGIPVVKVDRGGQVTYHGPGQLVLYTMFDLRRLRLGVRDMVRALESAVINWLASYAIAAYGKPAAPGVYVHRDSVESKVAALGLKVRNACTYHGIAVNIAMDLAPYSDIDPCGFPGLAVTDLRALAIDHTVQSAGDALAPIVVREIVR